MKYRWSIAPPQPLLTEKLAAELAVSPLLAQCLVNRGLTTPEDCAAFLDPRLKSLADPFLLPNMSAAVARLFAARERGERLVIFGDYDVDGVTSTALLCQVLGALGWQADFYLPGRMDEGYGLSRDGAANCLQKFPVTLLLAVDCGSTAIETIAWLRERGVDVIVLDHHQVSTPAPEAVALVNPQLSQISNLNSQIFTELCSVGLAFKLAHALVKRGRELGLAEAAQFDIRQFLDLVALGTIADLVPLTGENRILVSAGLEKLNQLQRPGLRALRDVAQVSREIGVYEVGFQLAPRLNAAGRLENAAGALNLILARDAAEALPLAHQLDARNRERQEIERGIADEAAGAVRARFNAETDFVIVEGQLLWHIGVVGIVASRVLREFYRPTIILGGDAGEWRGSGRSIEGFDLAAALRECGDLLARHGGHAMAAGLSVAPDNVDALRQRLNELARRALKPEQLVPPLRLDAEIDLENLTALSLKELARLEPVGQGNPPVQLVARNLKLARPPQKIGKQQQHLKFTVTAGGRNFDALWWNAAKAEVPRGAFDLAFAPQMNEFNGTSSVQLKVLDWRAA
ncbi:MAG: single-stranded-DNA-specific exonuclease RecJ [Verrucomicrobia bacterium]|nr:single-stranded-DNA-specific exonuclease RecJ [Verrucomicrobiota bacterium]